MKYLGWILPALLLGLATAAHGQYGRITGKVSEKETGAALIGANVVVEGTYLGSSTDAQGYFIINRVPPGNYRVSVHYIGYQTAVQTEVAVQAHQVTRLDFQLAGQVIEMGAVDVTAGRLAQAQSTALHTQRESPTIKSVVASDLIGTFPDANAAEALQRVPAVTVSRDHGEGRFVSLRGIRPEYNLATVNGVRIPSAEDEGRFVALDVVPADLIETIEVAKALSADMDGDAIGGSLNLVMKQAPDRKLLNITAGYGLNQRGNVPQREQSRSDINRLNIITGDNLAGGKWGYLLAGSYRKSFMTTESRQNEFDFEEDQTTRERLTDYELSRTRVGVNGNLLYKPALGHKFYFQGVFNRFSDREFRFRSDRRFSRQEDTRSLKDRLETQTVENYTAGGENVLPSGVKIDYHYAYTRNHQDQPEERRAEYVLEFTDETLTVPADPDGYRFDKMEIRAEEVVDRDHTAGANLSVPLAQGSFHGNLRIGAKGRFKIRRSDQIFQLEGELPDSAERFYLPGGAGADFPRSDFHFQESLLFEDTELARANFDTKDYRAEETVLAAYVMGEFWFARRLLLLPGVRLERTSTEGATERTNFRAESGSTRDYSDVLPSLHLRYKFSDDVNLRLAATRAISRPDFSATAPFDFTDEDTRERGNPGLQPVRSTNLDLMFEWFDARLAGLFSAGVFYKDLSDIIEEFNVDDPDDPSGETELVEFRNSGSARIAGFEVALQRKLDFLRLPQVGVVANYTFADSEVEQHNREDKRPLSQQSKHTVNLALSYEHPGIGLTAQVSWHLKGEQLDDVGEDPSEDQFLADHSRLDFSLVQRLISGLNFFLEGYNLTDEPLEIFQVNPQNGQKVIVEREEYGAAVLAGFKLNF